MKGFPDARSLLSGRTSPFRVLSGHFFNRLFQNDVFPFEDQLKERLYAALAILAVVGGYAADNIFSRYLVAVPDYGTSWQEKCYFLTLFMLLLAFAVALEWDIIFLDKRDFANLMPLPIRLRTMFGAKFSSFFFFVALYTLAVNALAVFVVGIYLGQWKSQSIGAMLGYMAAHLLSAAAANFSIFFLIVLIQAVLLLVLSPVWFRRVSLLIRFILLVVTIFLLMLFLIDIPAFKRLLSEMVAIKARSSPAVQAFPPLWYTGLYEVLLGSRDPGDLALAGTGLAALLVLSLVYIAAMSLSYRKHINRSLEGGTGTQGVTKFKAWLAGAAESVLLRPPIQKATFHFFAKTLRRSSLHKVRLAGYLAAGVGFSLILLVLGGGSRAGLTVSNRDLLAVPLILSFFLLVGLRSLVNIPLASEANWVFALTEDKGRRPYLIGLKKAIVSLTLLPLFGILLPFYAWLWGLSPALLHLGFGLACSLLLMELLFIRFNRVPFACSPTSGKANLHILWFFYVLGFLVYVVWLDALEQWLFSNPEGFVFFFATVGAVLLGLVLFEEVFVYPRTHLLFEEPPVQVMITLDSGE
jgi:hypothetical protein